MKWFKSAFARVHFALVAALAVTILLGLQLALLVPHYSAFATVHFIAGVSILALPAAALLATKNRRMVLRAFSNRLRLTRKDFVGGFTPTLAAKLSADMLALAILIQLLTGLGIRTGLLAAWFPSVLWRSFHHTFLYIIPTLAALHTAAMLVSKRRVKKPAKAALREPAAKLGS